MLIATVETANAPDPATPENRRALARKLLVGAIERYDAVSLEWTATYEGYPKLDPPRQPADAAEVEERRHWRRLLEIADESFDQAELALAEALHNLFPMIDPAGRGGPRDEAEYFVPRAVSHKGSVYVLAVSAYEYEPRQNAIAVYRSTMVLDLAEEAARDVA